MKYILKTEVNEKGNVVFSKQRQGVPYIYLAKNEDGVVSPVSKEWIIEHKDEIVNVRVSGDSIYPTEKKKKTEDFGEKIGGAKKDFWKLSTQDIKGLSLQQLDSYLKRDKLWPKVDTDGLISKGYDKIMALYVYRLRNCMPTKPVYKKNDNDSVAKTQEDFIKFYDIIRGAVSKSFKYTDIDKIKEYINRELMNEGFLTKISNNRYSVTEQGYNLISNKFIKLMSRSADDYETEALNVSGYLTPRERASLFLKVVPLKNYGFYSIDESGKIKLCKSIKDGSTTYYRYEKIPYDKISVYLEKYSLSSALNVLSDSIEKLLEKVDMYGFRYNRYIEQFGYDLIDVSDCMPSAKYDKLLAYFEKVERADSRVEEDNKVDKKEDAASNQPSEKKEEKEEKESKPTPKKQRIKSNLSEIERVGPSLRKRSVVGQDFIDVFGIRGGEFGNWVNEDERRLNMDMCFDSFADLAKVLGIPYASVAMGHKLNIAFGSRGSGNYLAHYECTREVINLTRMRGAGSLAHEYFHAIDDMYGKFIGRMGFASGMDENAPTMQKLVDTLMYKKVLYSSAELKQLAMKDYQKNIDRVEKEMAELVPDDTLTDEEKAEKYRMMKELYAKTKECFRFIDLSGLRGQMKIDPIMNELFDFINRHSKQYRMTPSNREIIANRFDMCSRSYIEYLKDNEPTTRNVRTDFYNNAMQLSESANRMGHGYWDSKEEICARAFACYVKDKLAEMGIKNDYLCGAAEQVSVNGALGYPVGEERKEINKAFDRFFKSIKEEGFFKN